LDLAGQACQGILFVGVMERFLPGGQAQSSNTTPYNITIAKKPEVFKYFFWSAH
jgi:hypothetical protein